MMKPIKCFWIKRLLKSARLLRRFADIRNGEYCNITHGSYHEKTIRIEDDEDNITYYGKSVIPKQMFIDPRWPTHCDCGYEFSNDDDYQSKSESFFEKIDTGEVKLIKEWGPGALWDLEYYHDIPNWCGPDGLSISCILPDHTHWHIDGRANNCTNKNDWEHRCWVRHGTFGEELHVDKNGKTCSAGAGSILTSKWHGFLDYGYLTEQRSQR